MELVVVLPALVTCWRFGVEVGRQFVPSAKQTFLPLMVVVASVEVPVTLRLPDKKNVVPVALVKTRLVMVWLVPVADVYVRLEEFKLVEVAFVVVRLVIV